MVATFDRFWHPADAHFSVSVGVEIRFRKAYEASRSPDGVQHRQASDFDRLLDSKPPDAISKLQVFKAFDALLHYTFTFPSSRKKFCNRMPALQPEHSPTMWARSALNVQLFLRSEHFPKVGAPAGRPLRRAWQTDELPIAATRAHDMCTSST